MADTTMETPETNEVKKPKNKKAKKPKSKLSLIFLVFWIIIIGLSFMLVIDQIGDYNDLRVVVEGITDEKAQISAHNDELQLQIDFFDSYVYIERQARDRLRMVRPDEIVFRNTAAD